MYIDYDHGVTCIDAGYIRPQLACFYLLREGDEAAVIETGTNHSLPRLMQLLQRENISAEQVRYVIPTHVHLDHAGGAGAMMRVFPEARLVIHPRGARHMVDPSKLVAGARAVYGDARFERLYGEIQAVPSERVLEADDGFLLRIGDRELEFIDTPGHARHHFCIWDAVSRAWFSGDCFGIAYPDLATPGGPFLYPTTTPVQFDADALLATVALLASRAPRWFYMTHFGRIDYAQKLRDELATQISEYVSLGRQSLADESRGSLTQMLADYTVDRLKAQGSTLDEARLRERLAMDMELNADGVLHFLQQSS